MGREQMYNGDALEMVVMLLGRNTGGDAWIGLKKLMI